MQLSLVYHRNNRDPLSSRDTALARALRKEGPEKQRWHHISQGLELAWEAHCRAVQLRASLRGISNSRLDFPGSAASADRPELPMVHRQVHGAVLRSKAHAWHREREAQEKEGVVRGSMRSSGHDRLRTRGGLMSRSTCEVSGDPFSLCRRPCCIR